MTGIKIAGITFSGSGKSTAARVLGQKYSIDVLCLNCAQHILGRQVRPLEEKQIAVPAGKPKNSARVWRSTREKCTG